MRFLRPRNPLLKRRLFLRLFSSLPVCLLLLNASMPCAAAPKDSDANRIVAVVNDEVITQSELNRALIPVYLQMQSTMGPEELSQRMGDLKKQVLDQLIEEKLMLQEAAAPKPVEVGKGKIGTPPTISPSEREVEEMLQEARGRFPSPEAFDEALQQQGITVEDLKSRFRDQIAMQKLVSREVRSRVSVSPAEITSYYEAHREEFVTPLAVQVSTILVRPKDSADVSRAQSQANDLHRQLEEKADFADLAKRFSDGFNPALGGQMGTLEKGRSLKEIDNALFKLKAGEITPVIKTPAGFQIFRVDAIRPSKQATLEEVQVEIKYFLLNQRAAERYKEWIAKLRSESYITIK